MVGHLESIQIVIKCSNVPYIYDLPILEKRTDCRKGALKEAGGVGQYITEAAPNELKLGRGA